MEQSTKAALISALVFPGAGHIYLKKYLSGIILTILSFSAIAYLISNTVEKALQIVEKIQSGQIPPDMLAITELLAKQSTIAQAQMQNMATAAVILCWIVGIIDSYRVGRISMSHEDKALR